MSQSRRELRVAMGPRIGSGVGLVLVSQAAVGYAAVTRWNTGRRRRCRSAAPACTNDDTGYLSVHGMIAGGTAR